MKLRTEMRHWLILTALFAVLGSNLSIAQNVKVIKFPELESIISHDSETNKVINFWATWCRPCVKEMPQFLDLFENNKGSNLEMILVSFDFVEDLESKLIPFIEKKNIQAQVYLLDETDYNSFINKIDPSWSGAIPATLMVKGNTDKRLFLEKEFAANELQSTYLNFIE